MSARARLVDLANRPSELAALMANLPGPPAEEERRIAYRIYMNIHVGKRLPGDSDVLRLYLQRGGCPEPMDQQFVARLLRPGPESDLRLLRTFYEHGYGGNLTPSVQIEIFDELGLWSVLAHPERWNRTIYQLVEQAQEGRVMIQTSLTAILPGTLARYIQESL